MQRMRWTSSSGRGARRLFICRLYGTTQRSRPRRRKPMKASTLNTAVTARTTTTVPATHAIMPLSILFLLVLGHRQRFAGIGPLRHFVRDLLPRTLGAAAGPD